MLVHIVHVLVQDLVLIPISFGERKASHHSFSSEASQLGTWSLFYTAIAAAPGLRL
jgi:hypothetical protein